ncbi:hypothetical protein G7046_g9391 [Stylonectria norvegica]|nr:hypothetical protein G7046_g9391 [Stylonectria norvegica]
MAMRGKVENAVKSWIKGMSDGGWNNLSDKDGQTKYIYRNDAHDFLGVDARYGRARKYAKEKGSEDSNNAGRTTTEEEQLTCFLERGERSQLFSLTRNRKNHDTSDDQGNINLAGLPDNNDDSISESQRLGDSKFFRG